MYSNIDVLFRMIREILNTSKLSDTKRLYEIIARVKSRAQANLVSAGHCTAVLRGASYSSPMAAFQSTMLGVAYYQFIENLEKEFDSRKEELVHTLKELMVEILRPEYLCVSYTGERETLDEVMGQVKALKMTLHTEPVKTSSEPMHCVKKNRRIANRDRCST